MPLVKSKSKKAFGQNVSAEMHAGKGQKQALAIAYSVARKAKAKKMSAGGEVESPSEEELHEQFEPVGDHEEFSDDENAFLVADDPESVDEEPPGNTDGGAEEESLLAQLMRRKRLQK